MTDIATLGIAVNTTQVSRATSDLNRLSQAASNTEGSINDLGAASNDAASEINDTTTSVNLLATAAAALISALSVREVISYADAWTSAQNSIRQVTNSTLELDKVTEKLMKSAEGTASSFSSTTDLYSKLKRSSDDLGLSQQDLIDVTTTINQSFASSGATAIEADNAIRQLAQGFASGVLRGDEFNSVAEQAPGLLRAVAKATNKATGELRALAAQGAITAEVVVESLQRQAKSIEEDFTKSVTTFSSKLNIVNNNITKFIGTNESVTEAVKALGDGIVFLSANLDKVTGAAKIVGTLAAAYIGVQTAAKLATVATIALNAATSANPYLLLARAIGATAIAIGTYVGLTSELVDSANKSTAAIDENTLSFKENGEIIGLVTEQSIEATLYKLRTEVDAIQQSNAAIKTNILELSRLADQYQDNTSLVNGYNQAIVNSTISLGNNTAALSAAQANVSRLESSLKTWNTTVENAPIKLKATKKATKGLSDAQKELNKLTKEGERIFRDTRSPLESYRIELDRIKEILAAGKISQETYSRAVRSLTEDLNDATGATKENEDALQKLEDQQQKTFDAWSENITDLIGGSKDLGDVLDDLARKLLQDAFVNPLLISVGLGPAGSAGGSFGGGSASGGSFDLIGAISGGFDAFGAATGGAFNSFAKSGIGSALGLSSTSAAFTGSKIGIGSTTSLTGAGNFLGGGFSGASMGGGLAANLLGLGSGDAITDTIAGTLGGAVGTAFGGPIGGAVGSFLGTALGGLFGGSGDPTTYSFTSQDNEERFEGRNALTLDNEFGETLFKVFAGRSQDKEIVAAMTPILGSISSLESVIASTLDAGQIERITAGVASADFRGENADTQVNSFVAARMDAILNEIDPVFTSLTESSEKVGVASLDYLTALVAINENLADAGPLIDLFDGNLESTVAFLDQIKTEEQTVTQAFAGLQQAQAVYYQNFFSEEERFETALENAQGKLDEFNSTIGLTGDAAIDTKKELRAYIKEGLNPQTVAGRKALEAALGLQSALLFVSDAADKAADAADKAAEKTADAAEKAAEKAAEIAEKANQQSLKNLESFLKERDKLLVSAEKIKESEANSSFSRLKSFLSTSKSVIEKNISSMQSVINSALSSRESLRNSDVTYSGIDYRISRDIVKSAAGGTAFDPDILKNALKKVSDPSESLFSNFIDYQRAFSKTSIDMASISSSAEESVNEEQKALRALQSIEDDAQKQIDAMNGVNSSVVDVNSSISDLSAAIRAVFDARSDIASAGGIGGVANNNSLESLYTVGLGRDPDQAGLDYWQSLLDSGVSFESVRDTFFKAAAQNGETVVAPNISGSDTGNSAIEALYTAGLGRQPDQAGAEYWQGLLDSGIPFNTIKDSFFQAAEQNGEKNINAFANGGMHSGGLRIVGERGPELELTGPSRIINNSDLMSGLSKSESNKENNGKTNMILSKMQLLIDRMYRQQQEWTSDALNVRVVV